MNLLKPRLLTLANSEQKFRSIFKNPPNDRFSVGSFASGDEGAGDLTVSLLQNPINLSRAKILSLLWARNFAFEEGWYAGRTVPSDLMWGSALEGGYMREEFSKFVQDGTFSSVNPDKARFEIQHLMHMIEFDTFRNDGSRYKNFSTSGGGKLPSPETIRERVLDTPPILAFEAMTAWNIKSYYVETTKDFFLLEWITSA